MHRITEMPLVSVIVTIYQVEDLLRQCIVSVMNQTYKNLEIILVNDGSTDGCSEICDEYAKNDKRIKVIHKKNSGQSDSQNLALGLTSGKYVTFVDGDDYILPQMVQSLYKNLIKYDCNISVCGHIRLYGDNNSYAQLTKKASRAKVIDAELALQDMLYQKNINNNAWGKLYKRDLFDGILFPSGCINQDLGTTYKIFSKSKKIVTDCRKYYFYRQREGSVINSKFRPKRMAGLKFAKDIQNYIKMRHPRIILSAENRLFMEALFIFVQIPLFDDSFNDERKELISIISKYRNHIIKDGKSKLTYRFYAITSYAGYNNMARFYNFKTNILNYVRTKSAGLFHGAYKV